jgi:asparagine synthase (glutamine-hydrolysing)
MCGIAGFLDGTAPGAPEEARARVAAMIGTLRHRGPDGEGVWVEPDGRAALGHRRLAILDLSPAGAQPMHSACGRWVVTYNGEVYNFRVLRGELAALGHAFRGHSDTEVLLAGVAHWGVEKTLERAQGMFAFALWDRAERVLWLARDRVGKKPLYYGWCGSTLVFGSELRALRRHPRFDPEIDRAALAAYVARGFVPQPLSIHRGARTLPPGSLLRVRAGDAPGDAAPVAFWSSREAALAGERAPWAGSYEAAVERLDALLAEAVRERLLAADVEVGALLSGGVDSATVVTLAQAASPRPLATFTIGFEDPRRDESPAARALAGRLGTEHHELVVTPAQTLALVPELPRVWDEPFADVSQIPTLLVARLARERVKVVLSGDGGDELFSGYAHTRECLRRWERSGRAPRGLRLAGERGLGAAGRLAWRLAGSSRRRARALRLAARLERLAVGLGAASVTELVARRTARVADPARFVVGAETSPPAAADGAAGAAVREPLLALRQYDFARYLPDDVLVKVDRATMSVGLEARAPLLDVRVAAFAFALPRAFLLDATGGKRILRDVLRRRVPDAGAGRKRGFGAPVGEWLRGPLRAWAEERLEPARLRHEGFFHPDPVREAWTQHQAGWRNHENLLWALLMFQTWRESGDVH